MENKTATLYDFKRMCKPEHCIKCRVSDGNYCQLDNITFEKLNEIVLDWCKTHPVKTRQSEFLKLFPHARMINGVVAICPDVCDERLNYICVDKDENYCGDCCKKYWSEVIE